MTRPKRTPKFTAEAVESQPVSAKERTESYIRSGLITATHVMPICAPALRAITPIVTDEVPTMSVDKYFRVYINPEFVDELRKDADEVSSTKPCYTCGADKHHTNTYVAGILCHEAWHVLREHGKRVLNMNIVMMQQLEVWRSAVDLEINDDLVEVFQDKNKVDVCLPPNQIIVDHKTNQASVLLPKVFELSDNLLCEEYYHLLWDELQNQDDGGGGKCEEKEGEGEGSGKPNPRSASNDHGSAADGQKRDYELGPPDDNNPGVSDIEAKMVRQNVAKKIKDANINQRGNLPGGWKLWADEVLEPPKYDWRAELQLAIGYSMNCVSGDAIRSYRRLGRRTASLMEGRNFVTILPSSCTPVPKVALILDTSGSMADAIKTALEEAEGILKASKSVVKFFNCDAHVDEGQLISGSIANADLYGGGGTDMTVGIKAADESDFNPDLIILLTDGHTPWPEHPPSVPMLTCLVGDHACGLLDTPAWMQTVKIQGDDVQERKD